MAEQGISSETRRNYHVARNGMGIALTGIAACFLGLSFAFQSMVGPDDWTWFVFSLLCFGAGVATSCAACFLCMTLPSQAFRWSSLIAITINLVMTTTAVYRVFAWLA